jgi:hypothetical protein
MFTSLGQSKAEVEKARVMLAFPCGLIRGALFSMGITSKVQASLEEGFACKFSLDLELPSAGSM